MQGTYKIITYGCQMNVHESEKIAGLLENEGYVPSCDEEFADVVVLNTCCIRESAETRVLGNLGILKKAKERHPEMKIIVCGCMTQADGAAEKLKKRCPFITAIFGTHNIHELPKALLGTDKKTRVEITGDYGIKEDVPIARTSGVNAWVNITYGCNNFCSYCIVPYVRGRERSRDSRNILDDVKNLVSQGYKQITLLGQNVNSYGNDFKDCKTNFASLLSDISEIDGKFRVKFMTSHPKDFSHDTVKVISQSDKISKFIHIPAQAGSDRILKLMNRKYDSAGYLATIDAIKTAIPEVGLSGDIMVGFPTETEEDFSDTLKLVSKVGYSNLYTFIYSRRNGTPAAEMEGQIDIATKKRRIRELIDLQFGISSEISQQCVGKTYETLCTEYSNGKIIGETQCGKAISFDGAEELVGQFVNVSVTKTKNSKLYGAIK